MGIFYVGMILGMIITALVGWALTGAETSSVKSITVNELVKYHCGFSPVNQFKNHYYPDDSFVYSIRKNDEFYFRISSIEATPNGYLINGMAHGENIQIKTIGYDYTIFQHAKEI